ncbi:MAG: hypothetical protein ABL888_20405, partial [Pirellulaceae bacterium]
MSQDEQPALFDTEPWTIDDQGDWLAARMVFSEPPFGPFDYSIPSEVEARVAVGKRIYCPLGKGGRTMTGYCVDIIGPQHRLAREVNVARLKPLGRVIDNEPIILPAMIPLAQWIAKYYLCHLGNVIEAIVPVGVRQQAGTRELTFLTIADHLSAKLTDIKLTELQQTILKVLSTAGGGMTPKELGETVGCTAGPISTLRRKGLIAAHAE